MEDSTVIKLDNYGRFKHMDIFKVLMDTGTVGGEQDLSKAMKINLLRNDTLGETFKSYVQAETAKYACVRQSKPKVKIHDKLDMTEKMILENSFPEFCLDFVSDCATNQHPFSAVHRRLMMKRMLLRCNVKPGFKPARGFDVLVKDVGSNVLMMVENDLTSCHCCCPVMSVEDNIRHSNTKIMLENNYLRNPDCGDQLKIGLAKRYVKSDAKYFCRNPAENCTVKAENLIFCHSTYDLTPDKIVEMMHSANAKKAIGCFLFDQSILISTEGYLKNQKCRFKVYTAVYPNGKKELMIRFWFDGDVQNAYVHKFKNYLSLLESFVKIKGDYSYVFSLKHFRDEVLTFEVYKDVVNHSHATLCQRTLPLANYEEFVFIYGYKWTHKNANHDGIGGTMVPVRYMMRTTLFKNIFSYAYNLPPGRFTVENVIAAARTMNEKMVINGAAVHLVNEDQKFDPVKLPDACVLIYFLAYVAKFENSKTLSKLKENEEEMRKFAESGVCKKFFMRMSRFKWSIRDLPDFNAEVKSKFEGTRKMSFKQWLDDFFTNLITLPNKYKTFSEIVPTVLTVTEQVQAYLLDPDETHCDQSFDETININLVRQVMHSEMTFVDVKADECTPEEKLYVCEENLVEKIVPGDGDCLFHSLIIAAQLNMTVSELKSRLLASEAFLMCEESVRKEQEKILKGSELVVAPKEKWGNRETVILFCKEFYYSVCVHTIDGCLRFFNFPKVIHVSLNNMHYNPLIVRPMKVESYFESEYPEVEGENSSGNSDIVLTGKVKYNPKILEAYQKHFSKTNNKDLDRLETELHTYGALSFFGVNVRQLIMKEILLSIQEIEDFDVNTAVLDLYGAPGYFIQALQSFVPVIPYGYSLYPYDCSVNEIEVLKTDEDTEESVLATISKELMARNYDRKFSMIFFDLTVRRRETFLKQKVNIDSESLANHFDMILSILSEDSIVILSAGIITEVMNPFVDFIRMFETVQVVYPGLQSPVRENVFYICKNVKENNLNNFENTKDFVESVNNRIFELEMNYLAKANAMLSSKTKYVFSDRKKCESVVNSFKTNYVNDMRGGGLIKNLKTVLFINEVGKLSSLRDINLKRLVEIVKEKGYKRLQEEVINSKKQEETIENEKFDEIEKEKEELVNSKEETEEKELSTKDEKEVFENERENITSVTVVEDFPENDVLNVKDEEIIERDCLVKNLKSKMVIDVQNKTIHLITSERGYVVVFEQIFKVRQAKLSSSFMFFDMLEKKNVEVKIKGDVNFGAFKNRLDKNLIQRFEKIRKELKKSKALIKLHQLDPVRDLVKIEKFLNHEELLVENFPVREIVIKAGGNISINEISNEKETVVEESNGNEDVKEKAFIEYYELLENRIKTADQNHRDAIEEILKVLGQDIPIRLSVGGYRLINSSGNVLKKYSKEPAGEKFVVEGRVDHKYFYHPGNYKVAKGFYPVEKCETLGNECGVVSDYSKMYLDPKILETMSVLKEEKYDVSKMNFIQSGPGTGKTTFIIDHFINDGKTLIVLPTINAKDDVRRRISDKYKIDVNSLKMNVRTYASVMVNYKDYLSKNNITRLWVDESLMMHAGQIVALLKLLNPKEVNLLGDSLQIPYVNREADFKKFLEYSDVRTICAVDPKNILYVSYRIPVDVAAIFHDDYLEFNKKYGLNKGLKTRNMVGLSTPSLSLKKIYSIEDVPVEKSDQVQYITFTQSDKDAVRDLGLTNVKTVNEFQGSQAKKIICVRLNPFITSEIFMRKPYVLVALTRHTHEFVYYTKLDNDLLSSYIKIKLSDFDLKKCLSLDGGGKVYYTLQESGMMKIANKLPEKSNKIFRITSGIKKKNFEYGLDLQDSNINFLKNKLEEIKLSPEVKKIVFDDKFLEFFNCNIFVNVMLRVFGNEIKYELITSQNEFVTNEIFDVMNINCINDYYRIDDVCEKLEIKEESLVEREEFGTGLCLEQKIDMLQFWHDLIFPVSARIDMSVDPMLVELASLELFSDTMVLGPMQQQKTEQFQTLSPVLSTVCQVRRERSLKELLIALNKRNFSVPENQGDINEYGLAVRMRERFLSTYMVDENLGFDTIDINSKDIIHWLEGQESHVYSKIGNDFPIFQQCLNEYTVDIKRDPKVTMNQDVALLYAACQTIVYHEKSINVIFCPIFKEMRRRLTSCLKEKFLIFSDCSTQEFEEKISKVFTPKIFDIFTRKVSMEVDISKFDKSQQKVMLYYECLMMRKFGVPEFYVSLWYIAHVFTILKNKDLKLKTFVCYQRKSGDAMTFFGNTIFLMGVLATFYDLSDADIGLFAGDDSYLRAEGLREDFRKDTQKFAFLFNLEVKFFEFDYPYFCSRFLLPNSKNTFSVVPDPVKALIKIGRADLKNFSHVEEYRISLKDNIANFSDSTVRYYAKLALLERYPTTSQVNIDMLMMSFLELVNSPEDFARLFFVKEGDVIDERALGFKFD